MENREFNDNNGFNKFKKRRNKWIPTAIIALALLLGASAWNYYQNKELKDLKVQMNNQYSRAFLDLADYVDNVEVLLAKALVTSTNLSTSEILEEVWRQSNLAQTNMGQLPVAPPILEKTSNFLTQVGDLAYSLNTKTMMGAKLSDKEYESLQKLHGYATSLQNSLHGIEDQINTGKMVWGGGTSAKVGFLKTSAKTKGAQNTLVEDIDKNFQEYPSMIYDGPYSDHMLKTKPVGLKKDTVTFNEAQKLVKKYIGPDKIKEIKKLDDNATENIETYRFKVIYNNSTEQQGAEIDITKQGGQVFWMLRNRDFGKETLTMKDVKKVASKYLDKCGYKNMKDTYYQKVDGTATVCYAYEQKGVTVYPDLVKVKVALDNGEVIGIEAKGYLYNHRTRKIPATKITIDQAKKKLNNKLEISGQKKAIIPTDFNTEKYCYEFAGKVDGRSFIIYINAVTGREEDILLLISSDEGTLTM